MSRTGGRNRRRVPVRRALRGGGLRASARRVGVAVGLTAGLAAGVGAQNLEPSSSGARGDPAAVSSAAAAPEGPFGIGAFRSDQPIAIRSDELEATQKAGERRLDFRGKVKVTQANLELHSDRLLAFYRSGRSQPERLVAHGEVRVTQGGNRVRCDEATYDVVGEKLSCSGNARVVDGRNTVSGDRIEFDLVQETLVVTGGARLLIEPRPEAGTAAPLPAAPGVAP